MYMDDPEVFANEWYRDREGKAEREAQAGDYYEERRRKAAAEAARAASIPQLTVVLPGGGAGLPSPQLAQRAQTSPPRAASPKPRRVSFTSGSLPKIAPALTPSERPSPKGGPSISQAYLTKMVSGYEAERRNAARDMQRNGFIIDPRRVKAMQVEQQPSQGPPKVPPPLPLPLQPLLPF